MLKTMSKENAELWEQQILFWRTHLDIFIEDCFPPIKLTRDQHVIARQIGNCVDCKIVQSRGSGKTWLTALCVHALCSLYPGTPIGVTSVTAAQATLVLLKLKQLADQNPNIANELTSNGARTLVQMSKDSSSAFYKNGSSIRSCSLQAMRGSRFKVVVVDESLDVDPDEQEAIVSPTRNARRYTYYSYGVPDFQSKTINITSACEKNNGFYQVFLHTLRQMAKGDKDFFACALDYRAAAANGVTDMSFFDKERERMPSAIFDIEYGSKFIGANSNSVFPYELTTSCRTLEKVELEQPKNSKSRYVIGLDIATSEAKDSDNSIVTVIKFTERNDGSFAKKLVYIRSYSGKKLDYLAEEIRRLYHLRFPNTEKIIFDARGLGDSLDRFFDKEWIDPSTGKEYPPLVVDDMPNANSAAQAILHPFRAVQTLNQRIFTNLRVALEKKTIELPCQYRIMQGKQMEIEDPAKRMPQEQMAIYIEADALVVEMGNIVAKVGASGNVLYDTPRHTMHKDRYSSLAMNNDYICELEKESIARHTRGATCIGLVSAF